MFASGPRSFYIKITVLVMVAVVAALVAVNRQYFFATRLYEFADMAANSLEVLQAKKFELYYGNYSRWGFHHPGPALFYLLAWGEDLFWSGLHLVPTPLNAQVLVVLLITSGFLAAGIGAAARWVRSLIFVPLVLLLAALHFSSLYLDFCMFETWTAYIMPIPFFCLIVTAATVAAGQGEDLPLLALTGCFILHSHVAHPLFVLPLFGLAYAGLWWNCRHAGRQTGMPPTTPWRLYPRVHRWIAVIVALFALPILIDLCHGADSNVALILHHLRMHQGERHPYVDAVMYFVNFGAYKPPALVENSSWQEIIRYLSHHPQMSSLWLGAAVSPLLALALRYWLKRPIAPPESADPRVPGRWRFLAWLSVCLAVTTVLTLYWAHIQDGPMYHYNAWFNFGIYFTYAVLGAVAVTDMLEVLLSRLPAPRLSAGLVAAVCLVLVVVVYEQRPRRFHALVGDDPVTRAMADTVFAALAEHPDAPRVKFLDIPDERPVGAAPALAILLKRAGYEFRVRYEWKTMLGDANVLGDDYPASLVAAEKQTPMEVWRFVRTEAVPAVAAKRPLAENFGLEVGSGEIDAAKNPDIRLVGPQYNGYRYGISGFPPPGPGTEYILTLGEAAVVQFAPVPVAADASVEIRLDFPVAIVNERHPVQRLTVNFNGTPLTTFTARLGEPVPDMRVLVPAALWNAARPLAFLTLELPDAVAPKDIDEMSPDTRVLAFGARKISFRVVGAATPLPPP